MIQSPIDAYGKVKQPVVTSVSNSQPNGAANTVTPRQAVMVEPNKASLTEAVKKLNDYVAPALQTVQFSIDEDSERIVVKVVDTATQKVLRQIPNEEVMAITKSLDKLQGLVVRQTA